MRRHQLDGRRWARRQRRPECALAHRRFSPCGADSTLRLWADSSLAGNAITKQTCEGFDMNMQLSLAPIIALLAGILILVQPRLLNYIVAIYLIIIGLIGLFGASGMRLT
jgi:hypothetical protein